MRCNAPPTASPPSTIKIALENRPAVSSALPFSLSTRNRFRNTAPSQSRRSRCCCCYQLSKSSRPSATPHRTQQKAQHCLDARRRVRAAPDEASVSTTTGRLCSTPHRGCPVRAAIMGKFEPGETIASRRRARPHRLYHWTGGNGLVRLSAGPASHIRRCAPVAMP